MRREPDVTSFADALQAAANLYGKPLTTPTMELYWRVLERYELDEVLVALSRHLADPDVGQFMPKPADIIRQLDGAGDTRAMQAWTKALDASRTIGTYRTVVFDDWRINAVIADMGGWIKLGELTEDEVPFRAREFEKRYRGYLRGTTQAKYPAKLVGREEAQNGAKGYGFEPPLLLGDPERARLVLERGAEPTALLTRTVADALPALAFANEEKRNAQAAG